MHDSNACAGRASICSPLFLPAFVLLLFLIFPIIVLGQVGDASISGRVSDPAGRIVQHAEVTIKNVATNVAAATVTNETGIYTFPSLPPGDYVLTVRKQGFQSVDLVDLTLYTQDRLERNFTLNVGSASESVTVTSGTTNESPAVSLTVTRDFIEDMPLNGRSLNDLIALTPGASDAGYGVYSFNGQRPDGNNYTVDGVSANTAGWNDNGGQTVGSGTAGSIPNQTALYTTQSLVSLDALQEFTAMTSGYTAEYGRNPGGQVEFTTRSGTDTLHGSLFEYLRNTVFDANSWNNDVNFLPKGAERQNDFGGTLGGALQIPHLYSGKGKTFYFVSYEGLRLLLPSSGIRTGIPSDAFRTWASPNVQPFLDALPDPAQVAGYAPTADGCTVPDLSTGVATACDGTIPYSYSSKNDLDAMSFRADHTLSRRWKLFLRYADTPSDGQANYPNNPNVVSNGSHIWTAGLTGGLSKNILSETHFNFTHEAESNSHIQVAYQGSKPWSQSLAVSSVYLNGSLSNPNTLVEIPGTSLFASTEYGGDGTVERQYELVQSISWTRRVHIFKFGADWRHLQTQDMLDPYNSTLDILSLNDVQMGNATQLSISVNTPSYPVFNNLSIYAQDHWKVGTRLTLDYGIRWEFNPPPAVSKGYSPLVLNQIADLATTQASFGPPLYHTQYTKFAPRFGFAYRLPSSSSHPLVLRGGGGIFYDTGQQVAASSFTIGYPYYVTRSTQSEVPLPLSQAALAVPQVSLTPPYGGAYYFTDPNLTLPYTEQWNLSVDRTMNAHNVLTISYVGNEGHKLLADTETQNHAGSLNPTVFTAGEAYINSNGADSAYNGLQVTDMGNITRDLQMVGSYTWSHALDDLSQNGGYYSLERGNSNYDLRQMLNVALNYRLPLETGGVLRILGSGWLLATRFVAQSGLPIDLYQTLAYSALSNFSYMEYRPNLVSGQSIYLHGSAAGAVPRQWRLNRAAFACGSGTTTNSDGSCSGTPTVQGTLGRNYVRNPIFNNFNLSVQRAFPISERLSLNFRVDAFNVFNHVNVYFPTTYTFANSQFGILDAAETIGSENALYATGANRSLQLNLHIQF